MLVDREPSTVSIADAARDKQLLSQKRAERQQGPTLISQEPSLFAGKLRPHPNAAFCAGLPDAPANDACRRT